MWHLIDEVRLDTDENNNLDLNFKKTLDRYSGWMKSQCRIWNNSKYDFDDLYSECLLVAMRIAQHHHSLGIETKEFKNLLFRSVKNRLIDLQRRFCTKRRNRFLEVCYDSSWDDDQINEIFSSNAYHESADDVLAAIQLANKLEQKLDEIDRRMLRQLLDPDSELIRRANEHEKAVTEKSNRRSSGTRTEIPVYILGLHIGLNYRQSIRSLDRIRRTMSQILGES